MIYKLTIVTQQGVKIYRVGDNIPDNGKEIHKIVYAPVVVGATVDQDSIYQVIGENGKILAEIINCPVEVIYL